MSQRLPVSKPTRTACFQPDRDDDPELFQSRSGLLEELRETIVSFIEPDGPGDGRILVRGHRGVGKSMLSRRAIADIQGKYDTLFAVVDGARTGHGPDEFMRQLARDLGREAHDHALDKGVQAAGDLLYRLGTSTKVTVKRVDEWTRSLKASLRLDMKFMDSIGFHFGGTRVFARKHAVDEAFEQEVNAALLVPIPGMKPKELLEVMAGRVETRSGAGERLEAVGFTEIARILSEWTDNAWAFLSWLTFLDYRRIDFDPSDIDALRGALREFARLQFSGVRDEELDRVADAFSGAHAALLHKEDLIGAGLDDELLLRAIRYGVLVPDWLLSPDRYLLAPGLHFLA